MKNLPMLLVTLASMVAGCSLAADVTPPPAAEIVEVAVADTAEVESTVAVALQEIAVSDTAEVESAVAVTLQETQLATDIPSQTGTDTQTLAPTPTLSPMTSTTAICENLGTHTYCLAEGAPVVEGAPDLWGHLIPYSPEFFCASDIDIRVCRDATTTLLLAIQEWGNYGPLEYWIQGVDQASTEAMIEVFCDRRLDRNGQDLSSCKDKENSREYGMQFFREVGAERLAAGQPGSEAGGLGGYQHNYHKFGSSVPFGFDRSYEFDCCTSAFDDQKVIFHEYYHAVQQSSIIEKDHHKREAKQTARWFNEGSAEFYAQLATSRLRSSGTLTYSDIGVDAEHGYDFREKMRGMLDGAKDAYQDCGGSLPETGHGDKCGSYEGAYSGGAWAHAYLAHKHGEGVLLGTFYPNLEAMGFEATFIHTYGQNLMDFYAEFDEFLKIPLEEQLAILPTQDDTAQTPDDGMRPMSLEIADFSLAGGVPNLAWLPGERKLVLTYTDSGWKMKESSGDLNFIPVDHFTTWLNQLTAQMGFVLAEPLVREDTSGQRRYFAKRMHDKNDIKRPLYGFIENKDKTGFEFLNGGRPVYEGQDDTFESPTYYIEVADITETKDGGWRLFYVAKDAYLYSSEPTPQNVRTAYSSDEGASWDFEFDSPFGETGKTADKRNADPAPLRLSNGSYMAVTMRQHLLYFWTSEDGINFVERDEVLGPQDFSSVVPNGTGLYDPSLASLDDGTIWMVLTVGTSDGRNVLAAASISFDDPSP